MDLSNKLLKNRVICYMHSLGLFSGAFTFHEAKDSFLQVKRSQLSRNFSLDKRRLFENCEMFRFCRLRARHAGRPGAVSVEFENRRRPSHRWPLIFQWLNGPTHRRVLDISFGLLAIFEMEATHFVGLSYGTVCKSGTHLPFCVWKHFFGIKRGVLLEEALQFS